MSALLVSKEEVIPICKEEVILFLYVYFFCVELIIFYFVSF